MLDIVCMFKMVSQDLDTLGVVGCMCVSAAHRGKKVLLLTSFTMMDVHTFANDI